MSIKLDGGKNKIVAGGGLYRFVPHRCGRRVEQDEKILPGFPNGGLPNDLISHQGVPRGFAFLCLAAHAYDSRNFSELLLRHEVCADKTPGPAKGKEGDTVRSGGWLFRGRLRLQKSRKSRHYSTASAVGSIRYLPTGKNYCSSRPSAHSLEISRCSSTPTAHLAAGLPWFPPSPSHLDHFLFFVGATFILLYGSNFLS